MTYTAVYVIASVFGLITVLGISLAFFRQGTVKGAIQTVELLKAQVDSLTARVLELTQENAKMHTTIDVLREQVTQAAPVKELAAVQAARHEENLVFLSRLEGSLSRVESKIMRGV